MKVKLGYKVSRKKKCIQWTRKPMDYRIYESTRHILHYPWEKRQYLFREIQWSPEVRSETLSFVDNKRYGYEKRIKDYGIFFCHGYFWDSVWKKDNIFAETRLLMVLSLRNLWGCPFSGKWYEKKLFPECCLSVTIHELVVKFSCSDTENCMVNVANLLLQSFNTRYFFLWFFRFLCCTEKR